jgi:hypothetical protein
LSIDVDGFELDANKYCCGPGVMQIDDLRYLPFLSNLAIRELP